MGQFTSGDDVVDVPLGEISRRCADVLVIFERDGAHPALGGFDGDLNHVLGTMNKIRKGMDVTINGSLEKLVLDARIDL